MASNPEPSSDLVGLGKLAKAISPKAWNKMVETACETFTQCVAPVTATTGGLGRLIQAWFDKQVDVQKVLAAEAMSRANKKIPPGSTNLGAESSGSVLIAALEAASTETNGNIRELWANLLAQELASGGIHPEFVQILKRMNVADAKTLASIASQGDRTFSRVKASIFLKSLVGVGLFEYSEGTTFCHEQLAKLNLIARMNGLWNLTITGRAFIESVSDPSIPR
jgi:hypothetical protein